MQTLLKKKKAEKQQVAQCCAKQSKIVAGCHDYYSLSGAGPLFLNYNQQSTVDIRQLEHEIVYFLKRNATIKAQYNFPDCRFR